MPLTGEALAAEIGRRYGGPVQMMQLKHGIFDEASISVIAAGTVREICRLGGKSADVRRFRPNIVVRPTCAAPFEEDQWLGGVLTFGEADDAPAVKVTMRDVRCSMVSFDPDGGSSAPEMLKAVVRANENNAGIYSTVTRIGRLGSDRPYSFMQRPKKGDVVDRNTMSRNAAQPGVGPDGPLPRSTTAALHLVENAIGPLPLNTRSRAIREFFQ